MKTKVYLFIDHKKTFLRVQENQYFLSYDVKLKWWAYIWNDVCFKYTSTFYLYNKRMSISVEILKILVVRCIYLGWYKNKYYFHMFQYYKWYSKLQQNTIIIVIFFFLLLVILKVQKKMCSSSEDEYIACRLGFPIFS